MENIDNFKQFENDEVEIIEYEVINELSENEFSIVKQNEEVQIIEYEVCENEILQNQIEPSLVENNIIMEIECQNNTTPTRKKKRNENLWKCNVRKKMREAGKSYISSRNKNVAAKQIRNLKHSSKCNFNCKLITENERKNIFESFYLLDADGKTSFILKCTERNVVFYRRALKNNENSRRKFTFSYFFEVRDERIKVCKSFFLDTLVISQKKVYTAHKNKNPLTGTPALRKSGKHSKKVIPNYLKEEVRTHINSFPVMDSHYCRSTSKRKYLDASLSINEMYRLYKENIVNQDRIDFVKPSLYREIFVQEFNLSFHQPKKDRCDLCEEILALKRNKINLTEDQLNKINNHEKERVSARQKRENDRNGRISVLCFDLQNVIQCPKAEISSFFYCSKLNVYNLTGHLSGTNQVYCSFWNETQMGRGGNEIASALIKILTAVIQDNPSITELIIWADSCVPQNRNSILSFAIIDFLKNNVSMDKIIIKYSVPGHSCIQEIDSAHSVIERCLRKKEFYSPVSLLRILLKIKYKSQPLKIFQMQSNDFKNYKACTSNMNFKGIPYTKVVELIFTKNLTTINYKLSHHNEILHDVELKQNKIFKRKCKRMNNNNNNCYELPVPQPTLNFNELSLQKIKSIRTMVKYMPLVDKQFFETILN